MSVLSGGLESSGMFEVEADFDVLATTACVRATQPNCCESLAGLFLLQFSFPFQGAGVLLV